MDPEDFHEKYGVPIPEKNADNIALGCLFAIRSNQAGLYLQSIGYKALRWKLDQYNLSVFYH